ncbi:MAG TPA: hypothetical protein VIJ48_02580 [Acidimicrobiia bacterium]
MSLVHTHRRPHAVSAMIYGLIVSASVMAAAGERGSVWDVTISVLIAVVVYWVADAYSEVLSHQIVSESAPTRAQVVDLLRTRFALVEAAYAPLLLVLVFRAAGATTNTAIDAGLSTATVLLATFGWTAAARRGSGMFGRVTAAVLTGALGLVMVVLKTTTH